MQRRVLLSFIIAFILIVTITGVKGGRFKRVDDKKSISQQRQFKQDSTSPLDSLKFVIVLHRHGDRTPIYYPEDELESINWPAGYGQLTPLGIHQLYDLGVRLREYLPDAFLPEEYKADIVYVRSTDTDRTLQSAQSLLLGIFPPGTGPNYPFEDPTTPSLPFNIQPIPIHTIERSDDYLLRGYDNCKRYFEYLDQDVYTSDRAMMLNEQYADLLSSLSSTFNFTVTLENFYEVYDLLHCEREHGFYDLRGIDNETYAEIDTLENLIFASLIFEPNPNSFLIGGSMISQFVDDFTDCVSQLSSPPSPPSSTHSSYDTHNDVPNSQLCYPRMKFYSAHDTTLGSFLSAFGLEHNQPDYADHIIAEFHLISGVYYINFTYNSEPIEVPNCDTDIPGLCPLSSFSQLYQYITPESAKAMCSTPYTTPLNQNTSSPETYYEEVNSTSSSSLLALLLVMTVAGIIFVVIIGVLALVTLKRRRNMLFKSNNVDPTVVEMEDMEKSDE